MFFSAQQIHFISVFAMSRSPNKKAKVEFTDEELAKLDPFSVLYDNVRNLVLDYLNPDFLFDALLVCREWRKCVGVYHRQRRNLTFYNGNDKQLAAAADACPSLTNIDLSGNDKITDEGLQSLSKGCPFIKIIDLYGCYKITNKGLQALSEGCHSLSEIYLYCCKKITDKGLRFLSKGCPFLTVVNLAWCEEITDDGIQILSEGCPLLTANDLLGCTKITTQRVKGFGITWSPFGEEVQSFSRGLCSIQHTKSLILPQ